MTKGQTKNHRISTKGPLVGQCNICGVEGPLTDDHTPPKSCSSIKSIEVRSLHDKLSASGEVSHRPRHFQAGVSFRSLCCRCNALLGGQYDPALADFCLQVRSLANSTLHLNDGISIEIQPQAVMRSVPAYDLTYGYDPLNRWMAQHQMGVNGKFDGFTREDLMSLADTASLSKGIAVEIVEQVGRAVSRWEQYAAEAGAPEAYVQQIKTNQRLFLAGM